MASHLCPTCGGRVNDEDTSCPVCGALNYQNREVLQSAVEGLVQENKSIKKFSRGFCTVFLILGLVLGAANLAMVFAAEYGFMKVDSFIGAVAGAVAAVFSIIGMTRSEDVSKIVAISTGASLFLLLLNLYISL